MERRFVAEERATIKIERREDGKRVIAGYGAVFYRENDPGTEYVLWQDAKERIMPGAFDRALKDKDDARGLFNHDPDNLLGRVSAGTMKLSVDKVGLRYEIQVDETDADHMRVVAKIERGDLTGSSFAFYVQKQTWRENKVDDRTEEIREIESVELFDTGPVTYPAYEATTTGLRAEGDLAEARAAYDEWKAETRDAQPEPAEQRGEQTEPEADAEAADDDPKYDPEYIRNRNAKVAAVVEMNEIE